MRHVRPIVLGAASWALILIQAGCVEQPGSNAAETADELPQVEPPPPPAPDTTEPSPIPPDTSIPAEHAVTDEPPASSEKIYQIGGDVVAPRRISTDGPDIAALARAHRIRGATLFQLVINKEGRVEDVELLELGAPELAEPIKEAVKTWRFEPATLHGEPVAVHYMMALHIRLQ